ncbi:MAG: hypothetical protein M1835_002657, partial [Candelina submexicana]
VVKSKKPLKPKNIRRSKEVRDRAEAEYDAKMKALAARCRQTPQPAPAHTIYHYRPYVEPPRITPRWPGPV